MLVPLLVQFHTRSHLKVTQIPGGQLSEATGFAINPENVVQVTQGENIIVTTSENLKVNNVKAKNVQPQQVDLDAHTK